MLANGWGGGGGELATGVRLDEIGLTRNSIEFLSINK